MVIGLEIKGLTIHNCTWHTGGRWVRVTFDGPSCPPIFTSPVIVNVLFQPPIHH